MKKKLYVFILLAATACLCLCGFTLDMNSSVKSLTKPYITTYDCTFARFGTEDLLDKFEYMRVTFIDDEQLEVSYKREKGKKHTCVCDYTFDDDTKKLEAEIGIFGYKFKQATIIKNGKFTVNMPILGKPLVLIFRAQ